MVVVVGASKYEHIYILLMLGKNIISIMFWDKMFVSQFLLGQTKIIPKSSCYIKLPSPLYFKRHTYYLVIGLALLDQQLLYLKW